MPETALGARGGYLFPPPPHCRMPLHRADFDVSPNIWKVNDHTCYKRRNHQCSKQF